MSQKNRLQRLRRSMMFLNAQRPGLLKDAYVYGPDCLLLDLEGRAAADRHHGDDRPDADDDAKYGEEGTHDVPSYLP